MSYLKSIWQYMFSPKLYKIYEGPIERIYEPSGLEKWGDQVIYSLNVMWNLSLYTSPIIIGFLYKKSYLAAEGIISITKFATGLGLILALSFCMRGIGRANNTDYNSFMRTYKKATASYNRETKEQIRAYDFDFTQWPIDFNWNDASADKTKNRKSLQPSSRSRSTSQWVYSLPCQIAAYIAVHTFGIRMIYPGAVGLLQALMESNILQGRGKLVKDHNAIRNKLHTIDKNDVDTMFIDNRRKTVKGDTLVICSEGNAGFYEIGIMCTPIEAGYSVLGWNHPGFAGSTGRPYPEQDQNAMDVVMQFAINKLGFTPDNIILFGWSIGGYSTSWAAMNYPDVKGVVLDATFDDVLPLALPRMPAAWEGIVKLAIRDYINLNIAEQMYQYPGPVLLIRRTEDEIICTEESVLATNRGNHLLLKLLKYRYPRIYNIDQLELVNEFLSLHLPGQTKLLQRYQINDDICNSLLTSYVSENSKSYPMLIGDMMPEKQKNDLALFLVKKYLKDYQSSHCTPLPQEYLQAPWDIHIEQDYVFT